MNKSFVAGATGFTGREVVRVLRERNMAVVAHVRPDSPRLDEWRGRFEALGAEVDTTAWSQPAMTETFQRIKPGYVFALLGTLRARMKKAKQEGRDPKEESYQAIDYGLTRQLIQASVDCGTNPKFIYLSAAGVTPGAASAYYKARAQAERALEESGLAYRVARPSFISGAGRDDGRVMERIGAGVADGLLGLAGLLGAKKLRDRYSSMTNITLAEALVRIALEEKDGKRIYEAEELR